MDISLFSFVSFAFVSLLHFGLRCFAFNELFPLAKRDLRFFFGTFCFNAFIPLITRSSKYFERKFFLQVFNWNPISFRTSYFQSTGILNSCKRVFHKSSFLILLTIISKTNLGFQQSQAPVLQIIFTTYYHTS